MIFIEQLELFKRYTQNKRLVRIRLPTKYYCLFIIAVAKTLIRYDAMV